LGRIWKARFCVRPKLMTVATMLVGWIPLLTTLDRPLQAAPYGTLASRPSRRTPIADKKPVGEVTMRGSAITRFCLLAAFVAWALPARATQTIAGSGVIDFDRPEAWAMKYFASATLITGMGPPRALSLGSLRLMAEGGWIPSVTDLQRTVGFNGTKMEDMNKLPVIGWLRATVGLPWLFSLTLSYLPPIPISGVRANLFSLSLGRPFRLWNGVTIGLAMYGQVGAVHGDFTCTRRDADAGNNPVLNPFGCLGPSRDEVSMDYFGGQLSGSYKIRWAHDLEPYTTIAFNYMNLNIRVNARYGQVIDMTQLKTQGGTFSTTAGLLFPITRRLDVASEVFYSPLAVKRPQNGGRETNEGFLNVRFMLAYRFF
jgi:hypothetical protein